MNKMTGALFPTYLITLHEQKQMLQSWVLKLLKFWYGFNNMRQLTVCKYVYNWSCTLAGPGWGDTSLAVNGYNLVSRWGSKDRRRTPHMLVNINVSPAKHHRFWRLQLLVCLTVQNVRMEPTSSFIPAAACAAVSPCRHGGPAWSLKDPQSHQQQAAPEMLDKWIGVACVQACTCLVDACARVQVRWWKLSSFQMNEMPQPLDPRIYKRLWVYSK